MTYANWDKTDIQTKIKFLIKFKITSVATDFTIYKGSMTCEKHSQVKHTVKLVYNEHGAMRSHLPGANSTSKSNLETFPNKHFMYTTSTLHGYIT